MHLRKGGNEIMKSNSASINVNMVCTLRMSCPWTLDLESRDLRATFTSIRIQCCEKGGCWRISKFMAA
ncbi:hypothetical protein AgCh_000032 [Apium graveolens]